MMKYEDDKECRHQKSQMIEDIWHNFQLNGLLDVDDNMICRDAENQRWQDMTAHNTDNRLVLIGDRLWFTDDKVNVEDDKKRCRDAQSQRWQNKAHTQRKRQNRLLRWEFNNLDDKRFSDADA